MLRPREQKILMRINEKSLNCWSDKIFKDLVKAQIHFFRISRFHQDSFKKKGKKGKRKEKLMVV